jgi:hypothetical protein
LEEILSGRSMSLEAKLYYLAIAVTASIPDICACLELDREDDPVWAERKTYQAWCAKHLDYRFKNLTGGDLYNMRGGVVHRAQFDHQKARFERVIFIGPEVRMHDALLSINPGITIGGKTAQELRIAGDVLVLGVVPFCEAVIAAARDWYASMASDPHVANNLPLLVRYRPEGVPPIFINIPVVA